LQPVAPSSPWAVLPALLVVTAAWPLIASTTRSDDRLHPVALAAVDIPGWTATTASGGPRFAPEFKAPSVALYQTLQRDGKTVGLYIAYYRGQDFQRKLVSSENVLVPSTDSDWVDVSRGRRSVTIGSSSRRVATATLRGPAERRLLAWQWYWIGGTITSSDILAKARIAWQRLTGRGDDSAAIVIDASIRDGEPADATLQAFARDAWPAIDAALKQAQAQR
jgi:EpsI family protein